MNSGEFVWVLVQLVQMQSLRKSEAKQCKQSNAKKTKSCSKAEQFTVMQNKCLKTSTAWFWRPSVLVYLYFVVINVTELNLLRALSWMAGGFDYFGRAYCLQFILCNTAYCDSTIPFCSAVFVLIWLLTSAFVAPGSGYRILELILLTGQYLVLDCIICICCVWTW